jgi:hypothetical protein
MFNGLFLLGLASALQSTRRTLADISENEIVAVKKLEPRHVLYSMFKFLILDFREPCQIKPYSHKHYHVAPGVIDENTLIYLGSSQSS